MKFNLIYDAAALAAPASFRAGIQQAATLLDAAISDPITVNITIDYSGTGGSSSGGPDNGLSETYSSIRASLINNATPGDTTFNALPIGPSIQSQSQIIVWNAELKVLGLLAPNDTASDDGSCTFNTDIDLNSLVATALHELTHAMGRVNYGPQPDIFDLFDFTSPGTRLFSNANTAPAAYFSVDGGNTKLADYGQASDPSDFLNTGVQGNDPFNESSSGNDLQQLTTVDLKQLDALGFHLTSVLIVPTVSSLSATTDTGIPYVNAGHVVTVTMHLNEAMTVTGTPTLQLNDNEVAAYTFGSGSNTLSFSYVAQTGDNVADLQVTGLNLPTGASIVDGSGNSLAGSVTSDLGIQVDTVTVPLTSVQQQVLGLYGVLYDRAADFGGLSYWTGVVGQQPDGAGVTVANGASTAITINDATVLGQLFVSTESSYFNQVYGAMSDSAFITTLYGTIGGNTIGIAPGITYWSGVLQAAETAGQSQQAARAGIVGEIVQAMIDYNINIRAAGYTDAEWLAAQQRQETTDNKVAVSLAYSNASQQPGGTILDAVTVTDAAFQAATRVIEGVTFDGTTADAAISNVLHAVALQDLTQIQPIGVVSGGLMG